MKRFFVLGLAFVMLIVFVGCEKKLPEGTKNREFYEDMLYIAETVKHDLETKTITHPLGEEAMNDEFVLKIINYYNDKSLTEKEREILQVGWETMQNLDMYLEINKDDNELLNPDYAFGEELLRSIKKFVELMEIEYEIE